ncbi:MAG: metallo-beta-lactamase superfamily [Deltaproteobacteria bacterium]|nr:metallo-beta-lactamase superfamily [Deltaproteobacteria bacterium]
MSGTFSLPLIPIFILYTFGVYLGHLDLPFFSEGWILLLTLSGLWAVLLLTNKPRMGSWMALSIFFVLGIFSIQLYLHSQHPPSHISHFTALERIALEGIIDRPPEHSRGRTQLLIRSQKIILSNRHVPVDGLVLIFLKEEEPSLRVGDRLRVLCRLYPPRGFQNPGGFSYERHLAFERIHTIGFLSEQKGLVKLGEGFKNPVTLRVERWRDHIRSFLNREADPLTSSIFKALVLGEQGDIPEEIKEYFILTGTAHLLAISGDQFGIVALLSFSLFIWILKRSEFLLLTLDVKKWAAGLTIPCIVLYAFIAGGGISVIRAAIMVITFFLSILFNRERNLLHTLALAAFFILIFSPPSLFDVSFQLSFLAVLSILYLVPRIFQKFKKKGISVLLETSWKKNFLKYITVPLLVTGVAILGTAPFVAFHFNRFSPIGFFTNLFIIPWVGFLIVPLSLAASIFSFFFTPFAAFLIYVNGFITLILLKVLALFASIPYASFFISTPTPFEIILFYLLLFLVVHLRKGKKIQYLFAGLCIVFVLDLAFWNLKDSFQKDLRLTFIDVGQGDSILVEFPKGKKMLIDGGGFYEDRFDVGKNVIAPFLWGKKIRRIDTLVLTHPDPDHLKGLIFIASQFSVGQFWDNGVPTESDSHLQLKKILTEKKIQAQSLNEKTPPQIINGVETSFLNPPAWDPAQRNVRSLSNLNNSSLVMRLRFKNISILLTGDIGKEAEGRMLRKDDPLKSDILKIPHHGSSSSSSSAFLERVKPTYAILSVGERNIGRLPHPEVLKRYSQLGIEVYRTDKNGAITVVTDGEKIAIKPLSGASP